MFQKLLLLTVFTVSLTFAASSLKIDPNFSKTLQFKNVSNIFVKFESVNEVINKVNTIQFATRGQKITHLVSSLKTLTSCQERALGLLEKENFKQFWVSNELFVKDASAELVRELARLPEVKEVREELVLNLVNEKPVEIVEDGWNLERIEAPNAWQLPGGNNGQGVVIANIDTGVRATHEGLRGNFRSSYGWFDPYDGTEQPRDDNGLGTHTMGVMVGAGVGVAPGAQWISCQGCNLLGSCTESALKSCGQWVICPTLPDGTGEDCEKAPRIVSNSWGGQGNNDWFNGVIAAWQGANIIPVFPVGSSGPMCGSVGSPADQDGVIAVSSTNMADSVSAFASNGPAFDGRIKPDLSAPGQDIRSAGHTHDSAYVVISGTSLAAPHVAGSAALLLSRNPNLTYNQVKSLLEENADTNLPDLNKSCNGIPSTEFPNNQYGHGRLNSRKSLEAAINTK